MFFGTPEGARPRRRPACGPRTRASAAPPVDVPDDDWAERSQAGLAPVVVGRVTVVPGEKMTSEVGLGSDVELQRSDPGPTSEVGLHQALDGLRDGEHHASTRLCLALLQRIQLTGRRVLDIGTGSGILAIAAWRLGAAAAVGLDHDSDALTAARESVELNDATTGVSLVAADLTAGTVPGAPFDIVLANLTGALITREARSLARTIASGGHLIISGVMEDEEPSVTAALIEAGLDSVHRVQEQEWIGAVFRTR